MKARKYLLMALVALMVAGCATLPPYKNKQEDFIFGFTKNLLFDVWYLKIVNHSEEKAVKFYAGNGKNYYVVLNSGEVIGFDSKVFYDIGAKGMYWVYPGRTGSMPFQIKKSIMQDAKQIILKGTTCIPKIEGDFFHEYESREISINIDIASGNLTVNETKDVLPAQSATFTPGLKLYNGDVKEADLN